MASIAAMGGAAAAATASVGVGGWAHLKEKLSSASQKVSSIPTLSVEAYVHPFEELSRQESSPLACVAKVNGRDVYLVCSGEVLLIGASKDHLQPYVALGGASVSRVDDTITVAAAGGKPQVSLGFAGAAETAKWFKELRNTAERRPAPEVRLNQLHEHLIDVRRSVMDMKEAHQKKVKRLVTELGPFLDQLDQEEKAKAKRKLQDLLAVEDAAATQEDKILEVISSDISLAKPSPTKPAPANSAEEEEEKEAMQRTQRSIRSRSKDGAVKNVKFLPDHKETHQKLKTAVSQLSVRHDEALKALSGNGFLKSSALPTEQGTPPPGANEDLENQLSRARLGRQEAEAQVMELKRQLQVRKPTNPDLEMVKLHEKIVVMEERAHQAENRCSSLQMQLQAMAKLRGNGTNGNGPAVDIEMEQLKKRVADAETDKALLHKKLFQVEQALVEQTALAKQASVPLSGAPDATRVERLNQDLAEAAAKERRLEQEIAQLKAQANLPLSGAPDDTRVERLNKDNAEAAAKERRLEQEIAQLKAQVEVSKVREAEWASNTERHSKTVVYLQAAHRQEKEHHAETMRQLESLRTSESKLKAETEALRTAQASQAQLENAQSSADKRMDSEKEELRKRLTTEFENEYALIRQQLSQAELSAQMAARQVAQLTEERDFLREQQQQRSEGYRTHEEFLQLEGQLADAQAREQEAAAGAQRNMASMASAQRAQTERIRILEGELVQAKIDAQKSEACNLERTALEVELREATEKIRICEVELVDAKMRAQKVKALELELQEASEKLRMYEENNALKSQISAVWEQINDQARIGGEDYASGSHADDAVPTAGSPSVLVNPMLQAPLSSTDLQQQIDASNNSVPPTPSTSIVTGSAPFSLANRPDSGVGTFSFNSSVEDALNKPTTSNEVLSQSPSRHSTTEFSSVGPPLNSATSVFTGSAAAVPGVTPQLKQGRLSVTSVDIPMAARVVPGTGLQDIERSGWSRGSAAGGGAYLADNSTGGLRLSGSMPHSFNPPSATETRMPSTQRLTLPQQVNPSVPPSRSTEMMTHSGAVVGSPSLPQGRSTQAPCLQPPATAPQLRSPILPGQRPSGYAQRGAQPQLRAPPNQPWSPTY